jgi:hypothetical protein
VLQLALVFDFNFSYPQYSDHAKIIKQAHLVIKQREIHCSFSYSITLFRVQKIDAIRSAQNSTKLRNNSLADFVNTHHDRSHRSNEHLQTAFRQQSIDNDAIDSTKKAENLEYDATVCPSSPSVAPPDVSIAFWWKRTRKIMNIHNRQQNEFAKVMSGVRVD